MVQPIVDKRPNYKQAPSCLTCPEVKDLLKRGTALICNKWNSWTCEGDHICDDHPDLGPQIEKVVEKITVTEFDVPKGYRLVKKKARKKPRKKRKTAIKKAVQDNKVDNAR